jgi:hypothetical protein
MIAYSRRFGLPFLAILFLAYSMIGCKSEPGAEGPKDFHLVMADSIISQYNADRAEWDRTEMTIGDVEILVKENRIELRHLPESGNEFMAFFLQTENNKHGLEAGKLGRCEVIYMERNLLVNSLSSKRTLHFYLDKDPKPAFLKEIKGVKSYTGFGLGVRKIVHGSQPYQATYCACDQAATPPGNCKAGGVLDLKCATSNEFGSCRVTCTGQTYACCDRGFE